MKSYIKRYWLPVFLACALVGCNDDFLEEKRDLTGYNEEVFMDEAMANAYVGYVYHLFLPGDGGQPFIQHMTGNQGQINDNFTQTTEELAGESNWNQEWDGISINQGHALNYFGQRMSSSLRNTVWTRLKQINIFLAEIDQHGLTEEQTAPLKGQMLFWRAYQYFQLLKLYGGVPLVLEPQNPIVEEGDTGNEVPRSSSSETLAQILADLDAAASLLPGRWSAENWGRITRGGAMAFKGRVLLTWASPLFNRNDDAARWQAAYEANLAARNELEANGFGLYSSGDFENAEAWENMWFQGVDNPEAVIVWVYNDVSSDQTQRNNGWEQAARSDELQGSGSVSPTKQMLDAFPMKDGKQPDDPSSAYAYDPQKFYKDRDPRFYKTFVYNGALWPYGGDSEFRQWTYFWYSNEGAENPNESTEDDPNDSGIYMRKATDPDADNTSGGFDYSSTNFMEMRFAEVILNLAESAIGMGSLGEGLELIQMIRERGGVENLDGAYGLSAAAGDRDALFGAVLNERKIELAYEGKRFWDLRRWMLFNDDYNTCSRLGVEPLEGTRRTGIWIYVTNPDGTPYVGGDDPLRPGDEGPAPLADREPAAGDYPDGVENQDQYLDYLYDNYFEVVERDDLDPTSPEDWAFTWYNAYYFFGLNQEILSSSPYLEQTQGWPDLTGGEGTFDPRQ